MRVILACVFIASLCRLCGTTACIAQEVSWQRVSSPYVYQGGQRSVAVDSSGYLYVGTSSQGIFRSSDNGETFEQVNNGLTDLSQPTLLVNRLGDILAGNSGGCFRSTDHGSSWAKLSGGITQGLVSKLTMDRRGDIYAVNWTDSIFRSTNGGTDWDTIIDTIRYARISAVAVGDSGLILAAGYSTYGIHRSTDDGHTWQRIWGISQITDLVRTPSGTFLCTVDVGGGQNLFRSTDNGTTWNDVTGGGFRDTGNLTVRVLLESYIFVGTVYDGKVYRSSDDGQHWDWLGGGYGGRVYDFSASREGVIFLASDGGAFKSTNLGNQWTHLEMGRISQSVTSVFTLPNRRVFARTPSGIFQSTDNGLTWSMYTDNRLLFIVETEGGCQFSVINYNFGDSGYGSMLRGGGVCGSSREVLRITAPIYRVGYISGAAFGSRGIIVAATSDPLPYRSINNGNSWTTFSLNGGNISVFTISSRGDMFGRSGSMWRFTDSTQSWTELTTPFLPSQIVLFTTARSNDDIYASTPGAVYLSRTNGDSWTTISIPHATSIAFGTSHRVFLGTSDSGVFMSTDEGATWATANSGLRSLVVRSIAMSPSDGYLFAATDSGIYRTSSSTAVDPENSYGDLPTVFSLAQNYPNPWNPSTTIRYALPHTSFVTLGVYNTLGQHVAQLVNEQQQAGYHDVVFRGDGLASGVYFYRLQAGTITATKKLIVLR